MHSTHHVTLSYLGLLPFLILTGGYFFSETPWILQAFVIYSVSILSFVAGSLWQAPLNIQTKQGAKHQQNNVNQLEESTVRSQSLTQAWLVVLVTLPLPLGVWVSVEFSLLWLAGSFVWLLLLQKRLPSWALLSKEYQQMRAKITSVVLVCHFLMWAQLSHLGVVA
jgi:hypothetical protein